MRENLQKHAPFLNWCWWASSFLMMLSFLNFWMGLQILHPLQFPKKAMNFKRRRSLFLAIFGRNLSGGYVQISVYNANNLLSWFGQTIQNFLIISLDASIKLILFYFFNLKKRNSIKREKKLNYYNFMHLLSCQTKVVVKLILRPLLLKCNPYVKLKVQKISITVIKWKHFSQTLAGLIAFILEILFYHFFLLIACLI